jgi:tRNA-specific adenosine deaminase 2
MFRIGIGQKEQWAAAIAFASGALGLALYCLASTSTATHPADSEKPRQDAPSDLQADDMNVEERAYHERFMREAIGMVSHSLNAHVAPPRAHLRASKTRLTW